MKSKSLSCHSLVSAFLINPPKSLQLQPAGLLIFPNHTQLQPSPVSFLGLFLHLYPLLDV